MNERLTEKEEKRLIRKHRERKKRESEPTKTPFIKLKGALHEVLGKQYNADEINKQWQEMMNPDNRGKTRVKKWDGRSLHVQVRNQTLFTMFTVYQRKYITEEARKKLNLPIRYIEFTPGFE